MLGGRWDGQITDERIFNSDWNPVSAIQVSNFDQGWSVEVAIPFRKDSSRVLFKLSDLDRWLDGR